MGSSGDSDVVDSKGFVGGKDSRLYAMASLETLGLDHSSIAFESPLYLGWGVTCETSTMNRQRTRDSS